jgi:clan AA aspartic protease (TIGR02281 family)
MPLGWDFGPHFETDRCLSNRSGSLMRADARDRIIPTRTEGSGAWQKVPLLVFILIIIATASGVAIFLKSSPPYAISSDVVGRLDSKAQMAALRLVNEPCNRDLAANLVGALQGQVEYAAIINFVQKTNAKCGLNEELLTDLFFAQKGSSDFPGAEQTAKLLVAQYPADPHAYGWRAQAREKLGDIAGAYADMSTALSLFLDPSDVLLSVYDDIARLAARTGHPCDAVATLRDYIAFDPENRRTQQLTTVMRNWQQSGRCPPLSGTGTALMRFDPNKTAIIVSGEINGVQARMIVDTGASRTVLSKQFSSRAGIEATDVQTVTTANGETLVFGGRADFISVGGARLTSVPVFIQDSANGVFSNGIDGLLGLSYLGNFHFSINSGLLQLRPLD